MNLPWMCLPQLPTAVYSSVFEGEKQLCVMQYNCRLWHCFAGAGAADACLTTAATGVDRSVFHSLSHCLAEPDTFCDDVSGSLSHHPLNVCHLAAAAVLYMILILCRD